MANLDLHDKIAKENLYQIGYQYLCNNFHKLSTNNKIRVAISVLQIFNKDGSKSEDAKQIIYVINGTRADQVEKDSIEILPSPSATDDTKLIEPV